MAETAITVTLIITDDGSNDLPDLCEAVGETLAGTTILEGEMKYSSGHVEREGSAVIDSVEF